MEEPVLRLVRVFWSTVPAERLVVVEEPVLRLVCAEEVLPVERLVVLVERLVEVPVLRLVRLFWSTELVERLVEVPVLRLVVAELLPVERLLVLLPVERFVRSV